MKRRRRNVTRVDDGTDRYGRGHPRDHDMLCHLQAFDQNGQSVSARVPMRMRIVRDGMSEMRAVSVDDITLSIDGNADSVTTRITSPGGDLLIEQEFVGPISTIRFESELRE